MSSTNEARFVDAESFSGGGGYDKFNFRIICLEHLRKICQLHCTELRGGYWQQKTFPNGLTEKFYVPDTRETLSNAIDALSDMLCAYYDEEMRTGEDEVNAKIKAVYEKFHARNEEHGSVTDESIQYLRKHKCKHKRRLFRYLCNFLKRLGYLEASHFEEKV